MQTRKNGKQRSRPGKRLLANQMAAARLWLPDHELLKEVARKRHITEAEQLRDIVHGWAVVERRAPGSQEDLNDQVLIDLQKETLAKLDAGLKSIADQLGLLVDGSARFGDLLNLNEVQLTRLINASDGHHNVSAQSFLALRSLFERAGDRLNLTDVNGGEAPIEQPDVTGDRDEAPIERVGVTRAQVSGEEQLAPYIQISKPASARVNDYLKATVKREGLMSLFEPLRHEGHVQHFLTIMLETAHEYSIELDPSVTRKVAENLFRTLRDGMGRKNRHALDLSDPRLPPGIELESEDDDCFEWVPN